MLPVRFSDGEVRFETSSDLDYKAAVGTGPDGSFSLDIVKGIPGTITGVFSFVGHELAKCPQFDEADPVRQGGLQSRRTAAIPVQKTTKLDLQLPFPSCPDHFQLRNKK